MSHPRGTTYVKHQESPRTSAWRNTVSQRENKEPLTESAKKRWRAQLPAEWQKPVPSHVTWNVAPGMLSRLKNAKNEQHDKFFKEANQLTPTPKSPRHPKYRPDIRYKANKVKGHLVNLDRVSPRAHRATIRQVSPRSPQFALLQNVPDNGYSTNSASSRMSPVPVLSNHSTSSRSSRGSPVPAYAPLPRTTLREPKLKNTAYLPMNDYLASIPIEDTERMIEENMLKKSKKFQENKQMIELGEILKTALPQHRPKELPPVVMRPRLKSAKKESPRPVSLGPVPVKPSSPKGKPIVFEPPRPASARGKPIVFEAPRSARRLSPLKPLSVRHAPVSVPLIHLPSPRASQSLSHRSARPSQRQTARAKHANAIQKAMNLYPNAANAQPNAASAKVSAASAKVSATSAKAAPSQPSRESVMRRIREKREKATRRVVRTALVPKKVNITFKSPKK